MAGLAPAPPVVVPPAAPPAPAPAPDPAPETPEAPEPVVPGTLSPPLLVAPGAVLPATPASPAGTPRLLVVPCTVEPHPAARDAARARTRPCRRCKGTSGQALCPVSTMPPMRDPNLVGLDDDGVRKLLPPTTQAWARGSNPTRRSRLIRRRPGVRSRSAGAAWRGGRRRVCGDPRFPDSGRP